MTLKTSDFVKAQKKTLFDVFDTAWNGKPEEYSKVFKVEDSDDSYEELLQFQSPDEIAESNEGGMYSRVEVENIRSKRFTHVLYKAEMKITREAIEDLKYRQIFDAVKMLGVAAKRTVERKAAAVLYNGFTSEQSPDAAALFSTHTLANPLGANPTTFSNKSTGKLTIANLKSRRTLMHRTLDEHGSIAPCFPDKLIINPDLEYTAKQMVFKGVPEPGSANHDQNVGGIGLDPIVLHYLAEAPSNATTMWFLLDSTMNPLLFFWRVRPEQELIHEEASGDCLYRLRMRFSLGARDYRGIDGNDGSA